MKDTYSITAKPYKEVCKKAITNSKVFKNFKRISGYHSMLEHANFFHGSQHLEDIVSQTPELIEHFDKFKSNDTVGNPNTEHFPFFNDQVSPTTIQYVRVLSDLIMYFGSLDGLKIVEIGAGYAGQCKIISDYVNFSEYICFELPEPAQLVKKYIDHFKIKNTKVIDAYEFFNDPYEIKCDLVISSFAFSEQSRYIQDCYLKNIICMADSGYLWMNETQESYGIAGIKKMLPHNINVKLDIPSERDTNRILWWNK